MGAPGSEFVMEEKLDGERMQLHMRGNGAQWCYWSRKAKDYSEYGTAWEITDLRYSISVRSARRRGELDAVYRERFPG